MNRADGDAGPGLRRGGRRRLFSGKRGFGQREAAGEDRGASNEAGEKLGAG